MIVDSSALIAILFREPDHLTLAEALNQAEHVSIAAPTLLEASMVVAGRVGAEGLVGLDRLISEIRATTIPFTSEHAALARQAFLIYGKGRHKAGLNFGDCISYATARLAGQPLLFKGDDFSLTDIVPAIQTPAASG